MISLVTDRTNHFFLPMIVRIGHLGTLLSNKELMEKFGPLRKKPDICILICRT